MNKEIPSVEEDVIYPVYRLKTDPAPFQKVKCWEKTGEVRTNDRNFQAGGILILEEYDRKTGQYTNDAVERKISEVTPLDDYDCPGKVLLSFDLFQATTQHTAELRLQLGKWALELAGLTTQNQIHRDQIKEQCKYLEEETHKAEDLQRQLYEKLAFCNTCHKKLAAHSAIICDYDDRDLDAENTTLQQQLTEAQLHSANLEQTIRNWTVEAQELRQQLTEAQSQLVEANEKIERLTAIGAPFPPTVANLECQLVSLREAASKIKHWHDTLYNKETGKTEGMVVSADAVRGLWEALTTTQPTYDRIRQEWREEVIKECVAVVQKHAPAHGQVTKDVIAGLQALTNKEPK